MDPILMDIPMPIQTPRLIVRPPQAGDGLQQMKAIEDSLTELRAWMPWAQKAQTLEEAEANVRHARVRFEAREDMRLHAYDRETGEQVVSSGLHRFDWDVRKFEIGYWVRTPRQGKGYVSEVVTALTLYAFEQLRARRVEIRCDAQNERSLKVARRLGFEQEGYLRNDALKAHSEEPRDTVIFGRVSAAGLPALAVSWPGRGTGP